MIQIFFKSRANITIESFIILKSKQLAHYAEQN